MAERAFVRSQDYQGIQLVKRLHKLDSENKQAAEIAAYQVCRCLLSWFKTSFGGLHRTNLPHRYLFMLIKVRLKQFMYKKLMLLLRHLFSL